MSAVSLSGRHVYLEIDTRAEDIVGHQSGGGEFPGGELWASHAMAGKNEN